MSTPERIPKALTEKFAAITTLTDAFCAKHLNGEYQQLIQRVVGVLARKRPSPLLKGREHVWAAAAVHAVGRANFLDDPSQSPHCRSKVIFQYFGIAEGTGQGKSKEIRDILAMDRLSPEWTLSSQLADNPMVWMLRVNGLMVNIRHAPIEMQRLAFGKVLIPYVPAEQAEEAE
jgi:hypothetical protein